jgi:hypothetical protein
MPHTKCSGRIQVFRATVTALTLKLPPVPVVICVCGAELHAQNKDRDVQALLAGDDALVALRQQVASKQIDKLEYTKQAQQLTRAGNQIVGRYDRAAAADKRAAAAEAARKADARARALAGVQAKQAGDDAVAAVDKAIKDDAQEYTRLAVRHGELLFRLGMKRITPDGGPSQAL